MVKLRKDEKENLNNNRKYEQYYYAKVVVTLDVASVIIRILDEDKFNPPYRIENKTNFLIKYRQNTIPNEKNRRRSIANLKTPGWFHFFSSAFMNLNLLF